MTTPALDLSTFTIEQLEALLADAEKRLAKLRQERRKEAFQQLEAAAKELGLSREDLAVRYGKNGARRRTNGRAPQYRDPAQPDRTWNGRGRKPEWVRLYLAAGKSLADLEI